MNRAKLCLSVIVIAGMAGLSVRALSQQEQAKPGMGLSPEILARISPNENHKRLEPMAGTWKVTTKFWMFPGGDPQQSNGKAVKTMILGGRYLEEKYEGQTMGTSFSGSGLLGFDNIKKKYSSSWVDSMSTTMMIGFGTVDDSGKTFTFTSEDDDPFTGTRKQHRTVYTIINRDKHVMEMFETVNGQEFKNLEVTYLRK